MKKGVLRNFSKFRGKQGLVVQGGIVQGKMFGALEGVSWGSIVQG